MFGWGGGSVGAASNARQYNDKQKSPKARPRLFFLIFLITSRSPVQNFLFLSLKPRNNIRER